MIITNLLDELVKTCKSAEYFWSATALLNDHGINLINEYLPSSCSKTLLIGIDLPTPITALRKIGSMSSGKNVNARIFYEQDRVFHPKVYIIKNNEAYICYIGSANFTEGGLSKNVELCYKIDNQEECKQILNWFEKLYTNAYPLDEYNLHEYEKHCSNVIGSANTEKKNINFKNPALSLDLLSEFDFSTRYFKKEHHLAFRRGLWTDDSPEANTERYDAQSRFLELHFKIYPRFQEVQLSDLHHNVKNHIVSMDRHFPGRTEQKLNAMWLSYGKSKEEIKWYHNLFHSPMKIDNEEDDLQSFINHARLQIRIELKSIGIWILFGKNNGGSRFDRDHFLKQMKTGEYKQDFFHLMQSLPKEYWIQVNAKRKYVSALITPDEMHEFCKNDKDKEYFIIGRDYNIMDDEMSETNLPDTVLSEFKRLYPIYQLMRHKPLI